MALGILNTYLVDAEQRFDEAAKSERWYVTCAIPDVDWPANWSIVPDRGDAPPAGAAAFPAALAVDGTCLKRQINFTERPGFVVVRLTYGYDIAIIGENKALVTGRTILVREPLTEAWTTGALGAGLGGTLTKVVGEFLEGDDEPVLYEWDITPGYATTVEVPYQQFRLSAILNAQGLIDYVGRIIALSGGLNSAVWTLLGKQIEIQQAMYRGCEWSLYRNTPGATRLYRADFDFLVTSSTVGWSRIVRRTKYQRKVLACDVTDEAGATVGASRVSNRWLVENDTTDYYYRPLYNFQSLLNAIITT